MVYNNNLVHPKNKVYTTNSFKCSFTQFIPHELRTINAFDWSL